MKTKLTITNEGTGPAITASNNGRLVCSNGMTDADWASFNHYNEVLKPAQERADREEAERSILAQADFQPSPLSMYVMGMCSDVQEMLQRGMIAEANHCLNEMKLILDKRMAVKDEHGRHDYTPAERARKGMK